MTNETELLAQFTRFDLDTKAASAAIAARDGIQERLDTTRRQLGALRPDKVKDFDAESSRLSNLLAGLDLALVGAGKDVDKELDALRLDAVENAPHLAKLADRIKAVDVKIFDVLLGLPDLVSARFVMVQEYSQLSEMQAGWAGELGRGPSPRTAANLPGGNSQTNAGDATLRFYFDRFLKLLARPFARPQLKDPAETKFLWWLQRF